MPQIEVQEKEGSMTIQAPNQLVECFAAACSCMQPSVQFSLARSALGAKLRVKREDFERMLDHHSQLRQQFESGQAS